MLEMILADQMAERCSIEEAEKSIRDTHAAFIEAHLTYDVDLWKSLELPERWDGGNGAVKHVGEERWERIKNYLASVRFTRYEDEVEPAVSIASDCSIGWAMVQVRVEGYAVDDSEQSFSTTFAWVELYRNTEAGWKMEGTIGNRAPSQ